MTRYIVDSWAWLQYLVGSPAGKRAARFIDDGDDVWTHVVTVAEVTSKLKQAGKDYETAAERISSLSRLVPAEGADAPKVGTLHADMRKKSPSFSLADAFTLHLATKSSRRVVTGDPDFKGLREAEFIGQE